MRLRIAEGYYTIPTALVINDPMHNFIAEVSTDYAFRRSLSQGTDAFNDFMKTIKERLHPSKTIVLESITPDMSTICPGYIYICASQTELRKYPNDEAILLRLSAPDDSIMDFVIYPRQLGYALDSPVPDDEVAYLISMPIPPTATDIMIPEYLTGDFMTMLSYK